MAKPKSVQIYDLFLHDAGEAFGETLRGSPEEVLGPKEIEKLNVFVDKIEQNFRRDLVIVFGEEGSALLNRIDQERAQFEQRALKKQQSAQPAVNPKI